jgi:hypothetical protein
MKEQEQWAREEEEWRMIRKVEEEGCKIEGEGGAGWQSGTSCLVWLEWRWGKQGKLVNQPRLSPPASSLPL